MFRLFGGHHPALAERGVGSVTGVDPGVVRQLVEQLALDVVDERAEV